MFKKIIKKILNVFLDIFIISIFAISFLVIFINKKTPDNEIPSFMNIAPSVVLTNSMSPTINPGDLIITKIDSEKELSVGDIVTFNEVINGETVLVTHRIINIYNENGEEVIVTRGDNHEVSIGNDDIKYRSDIKSYYLFKIPCIGKFINFLNTTLGFILLIIVPIILYIIYLIFKLIKAYTKHYEEKVIISEINESIKNKIIEDYINRKQEEKL